MNLNNVHSILVVIALVLCIVALFKPAWPLVAVAGILICASLLA